MRTMLRAVVLWGVLVVGAGLASMEVVHAADKAGSKSEVQKSKAPTTQKAKARPVSKQSSSKSVAQKGKAVPPVSKAKSTRVAKAKSTGVAKTSSLAARAGSSKSSRAQQRPENVAPSMAWHGQEHLAVRSGSALVIAQDGGEALYEKNARIVVPIASITKIMTAMVVLDSMPNLQAPITITDDDVDYLKGSRSRLQVGSVLTREMALLLALMSSENRAANALGRHYPGGLGAFIVAMNRKAASLGMSRTHFEDPTGLTSNNVSTAHDLARMVAAAYRYPLIREFSTTSGVTAEVKGRELAYRNTNQLVKSPTWEIGLSKTGYIQEAGKCLVMQARVADRPVVIVLLDSSDKQTRIGDANRIKRWMESASAAGKATPA
ncbi:MAG: D-alanyl-D-alanine endopeptidase [Candidatus Accumulibacter meliphilus]|jgi:D-alanyl-D-alanine endopeptidase (penicillin-binding protein 7)|uniref:D-alanyl-D-alanine endopeptidase n=1 Tax=Candidatus Accumulibacter meliphilus TaxID=2211374 RepID=A0A369XQR1_9PROT|nr:MAG: D-alanyl-D-alanine endopeptidase [Candidatus Accumulibacter meliphilus]